MLENFPYSSRRDPWNPYAYAWKHSMFEPSGGYLEEMFAARPYRANILNAGWTGSRSEPKRGSEFERHKRFTLASALLGDGFYCLNTIPGPHAALWWEPEYDLNGAQRGYLGKPRGAAFRVVRPQGESIVPNGDFSAGVDIPWRILTVGAEATLEADHAHYPTAAPSARVTIRSAPDPMAIKVYTGPIQVVEGQSYTLRFWARSSTPQEVTVHLYSQDCPQNVCLGNVGFRVRKHWKEFEFSFTATGTGEAGLNMFMGRSGYVWFDDIRIQRGDTNVFRRNFENGIVLLNYTNETQTISLGGRYRRLEVPGHPEYDGAVVSEETLPPSDARILLRIPYSDRKPGAPERAARVSALHSVSPNPFNPATCITFDLARPTHVRLEVYDVAGRRVRSLVDERRDPGSHTVVWDGKDSNGRRVASGAYLCSLETGSARDAVKLVLLE
ncbi:MAG: carbohydrate binding domain-containing protein [Candidatus Krumholzibacteriia bacterium]